MAYHILKNVSERGQILCTGPEWERMKLDDGPGWEMRATGPDWELSLDGGPSWNPMTLPH